METTVSTAISINKRGRLRIKLYPRKTIDMVNELGAVTIFLVESFRRIFRGRQISSITRQIFFIGFGSTHIIMLVALFTGMVLGLQLYTALVRVGSTGFLGSVMALSLIRELGPVLTAIMITARAGSSMATEIGIQRISEQIDALQTMRIDPIGYLVSPRIAASIISFPILTALFDIMGIIGGYVSAVLMLGLNPGTYFNGVRSNVLMDDITGGFIKAVVFGLIVCTICCFQGYFTHTRPDGHGANGVGLSTTSAVVLSCVLILIADYAITALIL
jgi:phospholipid/cholesterol/gamma-HCH transport system permease protein